MKAKAAQATKALDERVSAVRSALRSAPRKRNGASRSALKAAIAELLPDLLAFRAKGYSDIELADIMRDNGFPVAASTLKKYVGEARVRSGRTHKKRAAVIAADAKSDDAQERLAEPSSYGTGAARTTTTTLSSRFATTPFVLKRKAAKDVFGHLFDYDV
jgi:hypothetical protein